MPRKRITGTAVLASVVIVVAAAGCSEGGASTEPAPSAQGVRSDSGHAQAESGQVQEKSDGRGQEERAPEATVAPAHCPPGLPSCRSAEGKIVYLERVDPDGDGDAHFVISDRQGITLPGLTAIDVRKGLRPHPLPGVGELISAAGPVQTGSYGQSQIHALELHVAGR
jgi:hypothetical protein